MDSLLNSEEAFKDEPAPGSLNYLITQEGGGELPYEAILALIPNLIKKTQNIIL